VLHLAAARPGVGVGLADLVADVRGNNDTYLVTAKAQSDYGPIDANMAVAVGKGPLTVDCVRARPSPASARADPATGAGPFGGTVQANGSGVSGHVDCRRRAAGSAVVALAAPTPAFPARWG
jgi:translocation and assembly module TamB